MAVARQDIITRTSREGRRSVMVVTNGWFLMGKLIEVRPRSDYNMGFISVKKRAMTGPDIRLLISVINFVCNEAVYSVYCRYQQLLCTAYSDRAIAIGHHIITMETVV